MPDEKSLLQSSVKRITDMQQATKKVAEQIAKETAQKAAEKAVVTRAGGR